MDVDAVLSHLDGVATLTELVEHGFSPRSIQRLATSGSLQRIRQGVYAAPGADPRVVAAARVGGRAAGATAAALHGLWTPERARLTVDVGRVARLHDPRDSRLPLTSMSPPVTLLWSRKRRVGRRFGISPITDIVSQVLRSESLPVAIAILDSLVRRTPISEHDLWGLVDDLPLTTRVRLTYVDSRAESGTESLVRVRLQQAGFAVVPQFRLPYSDLGRVDMIVENHIIVECDSSFHDDPQTRDRDAARDLTLTALGFVVLRVRYRTAMDDLDAVVAAVETLSRRLDLRESVAI